MKLELWKDVKGYEGLYAISNCGNVKSLGIRHRHNYGGYATKPIKILSQRPNGNGYANVRLSKNCVAKTFRTHRLVAFAFICNPGNYDIVNHIDGDKMNNNASNLEWCSPKQNIEHAWRTGLSKKVISYREIAKRIGGVLPYVEYDVCARTPIGDGRIIIGENSLRLLYDNGRMENLIIALRKHKENFKIKLKKTSSLYTPLEDGSVPIEVIGKLFEPNGELNVDEGIYSYGWTNHVCGDFQGYSIGWNNTHNWFGIYYDEYDFENQHENFTGDILPYNKEVLDYLYQHHFDIHNLIESNLAIDINTLNK